jgi:hypothetical protein
MRLWEMWLPLELEVVTGVWRRRGVKMRRRRARVWQEEAEALLGGEWSRGEGFK